MRLQLLGTVQIMCKGEPVRGFRSRKALAVLGFLIAKARLIPREQLVDLFWQGQTESRGRAKSQPVGNPLGPQSG